MADSERSIRIALISLAALQLALGLFMVFLPGLFADSLGSFGVRNDHLSRDIATFYLALGVGLTVSARTPSWRKPVLGVATVQYGLHAVNHVLDLGDAKPSWVGGVDLIAVLGVGMSLVWLWTHLGERE